ncbi:MAG TPA: ABC transporter substrate-binding protein [Pseudomonadales bacterium]|jgi:phospholipid transport system substrate-binding protein
MLGILAAAIWLLAAAAHGQAEADTADPGEDPSPRIESFHAALLEAMRSNDAYDVRFASLSPVVGEVFDVPTIARISLGRTWKSLDEPARAQFCELLEELITATYTDRFDSYSGQTFHLLSAEPARRGWVVKTELEKSDGERVSLDYYFRGSRVFNVVADGVSDLSLRRADYNSIVKQEGYDRLLAHIRDSIAEYEAGGTDG